MAKPLVLITGANGTLGYEVVLNALRAGYSVRAAVRGQAGVDCIKSGDGIASFLDNGLDFVFVPDITVDNAYDEAVKDCDFIIHCASPLPGIPGDLAIPAMGGCRNIMHAAQKTASVKRVVVTGSSSSVRPFSRMLPEDPDNAKVAAGQASSVEIITGSTRLADPPKLPDTAPSFQRYGRSKIMSTNYVRDFVAREKPHFSVVLLMPGFIIGPCGIVKSKMHAAGTGTAMLAWLWFSFSIAAAYGRPETEKMPQVAETVAFGDVVEAHIKALDMGKVPGTFLEYLMCSDGPRGPVFEDAVNIIKQKLPQLVENGQVPLNNEAPGTIPHHFDSTAVEREVLGRPMKNFEEIVMETVQWMVTLPDA